MSAAERVPRPSGASAVAPGPSMGALLASCLAATAVSTPPARPAASTPAPAPVRTQAAPESEAA
ncbi:hypothetical protein ACIBEA_10515 [Streptomyces sp. NPDC051555]|uniref:hypothetical protein n=1 Tax=Streptomyces sp. NPDC051555 TaxID=3365657 RepID=UPI0037AE8E5B